MVAAKSSRVDRQYKRKYRIRNWKEYERGLKSRGDVTIWLSEDAIAAWVPPKNGLRGRPPLGRGTGHGQFIDARVNPSPVPRNLPLDALKQNRNKTTKPEQRAL